MFPGSTLYQMIVAIRKYLNVNRINLQLIDVKFPDFKIVLDNIMKERAALNVGVTTKRASLITYELEHGIMIYLVKNTPYKLFNIEGVAVHIYSEQVLIEKLVKEVTETQVRCH